MGTDDSIPAATQPPKKLPFNNLYLLSGLVHGQNKAWMYVFTFLLTLFGYFTYQLMVGFPLLKILFDKGYNETDLTNNPNLLFDATALGLDRNVVVLLEMGMFVFGLMALYVGIRAIHRKTLTSVLTGYEKFRFGRFWFAFCVWGVMIGVAVMISWFTSPGELVVSFEPSGFIVSFIILLIFIPLQTLWEELLFRGYLVQGLSQVFRNGIFPLLLTSIMFGAAHLSNPEVRQHGAPIMLTYYLGSALFLGALTLIDEGIELAFGLHFANNFVSALLVSSPSSVLKPYAVFEATTENPQAEVLLWLVMATVAFFIFRMRYKWRNFNLLIR